MAVMFEDIEMPPFQKLGVIVATHRAIALGTSHRRPKPKRFLDLEENTVVLVKAAVSNLPLAAQAQHLMK